MNRLVSSVFLISISSALLAISVCKPSVLNDDNTFLRNFANYEAISLLGVIASISIASIAQALISLTNIEREHKGEIFTKTKSGLKLSALSFAISLILIILLSIIKGSITNIENNFQIVSIINSAYIILLFWSIFEMSAIIGLIFKIPSNIH